MLNTDDYYRNANQENNDIISHLSERLSSKSLQITNVGEDMEKRKPLYTVGENVNRCSHYGKG